MKPFPISESCYQLVDHYPEPEILKAAALAMGQSEREYLLRLWLSEGIPFAFRGAPAVYEAVRGWLASRLGVHPKLITLIGSGRIGYSLAPSPKFGIPFASNSDLDFTVISESLFAALSEVFEQWSADVRAGRVHPRGPNESKYWEDNLARLPRTIERGFVDARKIPYFNRYSIAQRIGQVMYEMSERLAATQGGPRVKRISIRAYRDWDAFLKQMRLSFSTVITNFQRT